MNRAPLRDLHPTSWFDWIVQTKALEFPGCMIRSSVHGAGYLGPNVYH